MKSTEQIRMNEMHRRNINSLLICFFLAFFFFTSKYHHHLVINVCEGKEELISNLRPIAIRFIFLKGLVYEQSLLAFLIPNWKEKDTFCLNKYKYTCVCVFVKFNLQINLIY